MSEAKAVASPLIVTNMLESVLLKVKELESFVVTIPTNFSVLSLLEILLLFWR